MASNPTADVDDEWVRKIEIFLTICSLLFRNGLVPLYQVKILKAFLKWYS